MSVDYPGALDMMLPINYSFNSVDPLVIVIHKTGGDATLDAVHNTFLSTMRSTHFAIDESGNVAQFVPLNRGAGGNCCADKTHNPFWNSYINEYGNLNYCTISIEHCDNTSTNTEVMSQAQIDASNKLVKWLCDRFNIPVTHIKGHNSINDTTCPGDYNFTTLFNYLKASVTMTPNQQKQFNDIWQSTYIPVVTNGIVTYVHAPIGTGINALWNTARLHGIFLGAPNSLEYPSIDWSGNPIVCQDFGSEHIEWQNGNGRIFGPQGELTF